MGPFPFYLPFSSPPHLNPNVHFPHLLPNSIQFPPNLYPSFPLPYLAPLFHFILSYFHPSRTNCRFFNLFLLLNASSNLAQNYNLPIPYVAKRAQPNTGINLTLIGCPATLHGDIIDVGQFLMFANVGSDVSTECCGSASNSCFSDTSCQSTAAKTCI